MRIIYIANIRMPTERAHGIQIVKTCEALKKAGADIELVVPDRHTPIHENVTQYYGLKESFPVIRVPVFDTVWWGVVGFALETVSFAWSVFRYLHGKPGVVYGRDEWVLALLRICGTQNIVWESHTGAWNMAARFLARRIKIVTISEGLKDFYVSNGVAPESITVAHDGVDLAQFEHVESMSEVRKRLGISEDTKVALYIGALGGWKGTDTLFAASELLPADMTIAVITGADTRALKMQYPRVQFLGAEPYAKIANNQAAADALILPTSTRDSIGARFTSPLKLFTYMASGIPIIASDVSSTREVLPREAAYWFTADDAESCARAIQEALEDAQSKERARVAKSAVQGYTWDTRARNILAHLTS
jgi:glycosyltransferase involved in cell wall biosynthesis